MRKNLLLSVVICSFLVLSGCIPVMQPVTSTPTLANTATATATALPPSPTPIPATPTPIPTSTLVPSPTPVPVYLPATVWTSDPQVPVLAYHRFYPDSFENLPPTKMRLSDFKAHLQSLYDSGYSLVQLADWLKGDMHVPAGRKPLIITMDDLFSSDQIFLNPDGTPSEKSGIGLLWHFSQAHPDFGFAVALFYNMGDKHYGNVQVGDWWQEGPGWEDSLAKAIAWCIQNGAMPYNHFYTHPQLDLITSVKDFNYQAQENEKQLRVFLGRIGQASLADNLDNLFAIPYDIWPTVPAVKKALENYVSTNQKPLLGLLDIDYAIRAKYLQPVYSPQFDRFHIPRIVDVDDNPTYWGDVIKLLSDNSQTFPAAQECQLGPLDTTRASDQAYVEQLISDAGANGACPQGVYSTDEGLFRLQDGQVSEIPIIVK